MIYNEVYRNLFSVPADYYLAHCISADFGMGKGIVIEFNKIFNMKNRLRMKYQKQWNGHGYCIIEDRVFNLITKEFYYNKPTYNTITEAILDMKNQALKNNISKIAMPIIGCGLDKLEWVNVSGIIKKVFSDTDIEILVCKQ